VLKFAFSSQNVEKKIILSKKRGEITRFDGTFNKWGKNFVSISPTTLNIDCFIKFENSGKLFFILIHRRKPLWEHLKHQKIQNNNFEFFLTVHFRKLLRKTNCIS